METPRLDAWIIDALGDKWWIAVIAILVMSLVQLYFFVTKEPAKFLHPDLYQDLLLKQKQNVNHNTRFLQFKLQDDRQRVGLPVGQHILFKFVDGEGRSVIRPYTPVSSVKATGHVDFVIKVYPKGEMSQHIDQLDVGDRISAKGPRGKFVYRRNMKRALGMICGGTGITPMYQILNHILSDPKDRTRLHLIYANITISDILLKQDLDRLAAQHPTRFDIFYVVEKQEPSNWKGGVGYVTKDIIKNHCPPPSSNIMMLHCGPPPMTDAMMKACNELGYSVEQQFKF